MKIKGLLIGAVLVVITLATIPYFVGRSTQQQITDYVALFDAEQPAYRASLLSYERTWFDANAVISLELDLDALPGLTEVEQGKFKTELQMKIEHGPLLTRDGFAFGWNAWTITAQGNDLREHLNWDTAQPFYRQQGWVNLLGDATFEDAMPALQSDDSVMEFALNMAPYRGTGTYVGNKFQYAGVTEQLEITVDDFAVNMNKVAVTMDATAAFATMLAGELYPTQGQFSVAQITAGNDENNVFTLDKLSIHSSFEFVDDLLNMHMDYRADQLTTPSITASDMQFSASVRNLDRQVTEAYFELMKEAYQSKPEVMAERLSAFTEQYGLQFLQAEPELVINRFNSEFPEGRIHGDAKLGIRGVTALPAAPDDTVFWLRHAYADAFVEIDKPVFAWLLDTYATTTVGNQNITLELNEEQRKAHIEGYKAYLQQSLIQQGILQETETSFQAEVQLNDGVLQLNGKSQTLLAPN